MATVLHTFVYFMACFFAFLPSIVLGDLIGHGGMVRTLAFSSDGRKVLSGSFDFSSVLWDFEEQREIASFDGHSGPVNSVVFIPGSNRVASTGDDGLVMLWDVTNGKVNLTGKLEGHNFKVMALGVSKTGDKLASGSWDKTVRIWNCETGKLIGKIKLPVPVNALTFINDDQVIAVGGHDPTIRLVNSVTGKVEGKLEGHKMGITALAVSLDGKLLASASIDKTVRLWDLNDFSQVKEFEHIDSQVYAVRFLPDGKTLVSAGRDGAIAHWNIEAGEVVRYIKAHDASIWSLAVTPDGRFVISGSSDDTVRVWHIQTGDRIGLSSEKLLKGKPKPWLTSSHPGAKLFSKCARCHSLSNDGTKRSGPHLKGLFGRRVGSIDDYNYSIALQSKSFEWNEKTLFKLFDQGPEKFLPGTKMPVQRVTDSQELMQLVDYLKTATALNAGIK